MREACKQHGQGRNLLWKLGDRSVAPPEKLSIPWSYFLTLEKVLLTQMCTAKCLKEKMVNHMLGDRGDSKSHQKRGVLLSETTVTVFGNKAGDRETRLATEETVQRDAGGG